MLHTSTSIERVLAKFIRDTKISDSSLISDLKEWIGEGIEKLETKWQLDSKYCILTITNYKTKLPCGLRSIESVTYNGKRLRNGTPQISVEYPPLLNRNNSSAFVFVPDLSITFEGSIQNQMNTRISGTDIVQSGEDDNSEYYVTQLDYIKTSFKEGKIVLYFLQQPVDNKGYPLIPDNANYLTALSWYLRMMAIGSGWQDPIFRYADCEERWNIFAARAINEVKYPNVDRMETLRMNSSRIIFPEHLYDDIFINAEQYQGTSFI